MTEVEFLEGFDPALDGCESGVVGGDGGGDWVGVDVVIDQCVVAASDVGDVIGAFVESGLDIENHAGYWSRRQSKAKEGIG